MKNRLIDANEMKNNIMEAMMRQFEKNGDQIALRIAEMMWHFIDETDTVDAVEVVHGRWEDEYGGKYANPRYRCSVCKGKALYTFKQDEFLSWHEVQALTDYCPNCGADMRERNN